MKKYLYIILLISFSFFSCIKQQVHPPAKDDHRHEMKARDHFSSGMFYELENKHENALIEYYQALLYDSSSSTIYNRIAENHMALGRYESALRYLQKSMRMNPDESETIRLIADCHYRLKDDERAIHNLKKVLQLNPFDENARSLLLLLYRKNNNDIGLAQQYEELINLYGEDEDWIRKAATIYLKNGKVDEALTLFELYIHADSSNASMWFSIGMAHELKNDPNTALDAYRQALDLAPQVAEAAERIYHICRKEEKWVELIEFFSPYTDTLYAPIYRLATADAYLSKEDRDLQKSEAILLPMIQEENIPWQTYDLLGRVKWGMKDYKEAAEYFQNIIDLDSKNRIGWIFKGFVLSDADSLEKAENHYQHALKYLPNDPFLLTFHGIALQRLERDEEAIVQFEKSMKIDSTNTNTLVSYGFSLNRLERKSQAIVIMEQVLIFDPENYNAISSLGMLYDELKIYDKCDSLYEKALKYYPNNALFLNNYAYTLAERSERLEDALEMARKAVEAEPENSAYQDTMGWIYYMLGRYNLALVHIKRSVEQQQDNAVVIEHLGDVYLKLGEIEDAQSHWKRALDMDEDNERLKTKIENIRHEM